MCQDCAPVPVAGVPLGACARCARPLALAALAAAIAAAVTAASSAGATRDPELQRRRRRHAWRVGLEIAEARGAVEAMRMLRAADEYRYAPHTRRGQLERLTRQTRLRRAHEHMQRARAARRADRAGDRTRDWIQLAEWHEARAAGQHERYHRLHQCGATLRKATCHSCAESHYAPHGCGLIRECASCRDRRAHGQRARVARAIDAYRELVRRRGGFIRFRRGGRWGERHFTLTIPERGLGTAERVALLYGSWSRFVRWFTRWARRHAIGGLRPAYYRAFEVTPGADSLGHPHFHVWLLGPYLDHVELRAAWVRAVRSEAAARGLTLQGEPIDPYVTRCKAEFHEQKGRRALKLVQSDGTFVDYLESWVIGEADKKGRWMRVDAEARLYDALTGRRLAQGSRGFLALGWRPVTCRCCGATHVAFGNHWAPVFFCRILTAEETAALAAAEVAHEERTEGGDLCRVG